MRKSPRLPSDMSARPRASLWMLNLKAHKPEEAAMFFSRVQKHTEVWRHGSVTPAAQRSDPNKWEEEDIYTVLYILCMNSAYIYSTQGRTLLLGKVSNCLGPQLIGSQTATDLLWCLNMKILNYVSILTHLPRNHYRRPQKHLKYATVYFYLYFRGKHCATTFTWWLNVTGYIADSDFIHKIHIISTLFTHEEFLSQYNIFGSIPSGICFIFRQQPRVNHQYLLFLTPKHSPVGKNLFFFASV